jgi:hypothetical protein
MFKGIIVALLLASFFAPATLAQEAAPSQSDQDYVSKLSYRHNKLELVTKKRMIDEKQRYSYTDIDTYTYPSSTAYPNVSTSISSQHLSRRETKEINEWYVYMGGISELSDVDFLRLVGDQQELSRVIELENSRGKMVTVGNILIGAGAIAMVGGAALSASTSVITGGAITLVAGFVIDSFNAPPPHYISSQYALAKIDDYNLALKKKLNLPLSYE